jgi:hypothetical protein
MNASAKGHLSKVPINRTSVAVEHQVTAMAADLFEIGLYNPDAGPTESAMIPRVWDAEAILKSLPWLRHQNRDGRNIYIRPKGEHHLSLVDDLTKDALLPEHAKGYCSPTRALRVDSFHRKSSPLSVRCHCLVAFLRSSPTRADKLLPTKPNGVP